MVTVEFTLPDPWLRSPPPSGVAICAERGDLDAALPARVTVTLRPVAPSPDPGLMARALEGFRLIDQGSFETGYGLGEWLVAYYLAKGRVPVTMHTWQLVHAGAAVQVVATIPCRDYDGLVDEVEFAVQTVRLGVGG